MVKLYEISERIHLVTDEVGNRIASFRYKEDAQLYVKERNKLEKLLEKTNGWKLSRDEMDEILKTYETEIQENK